VWRSLTYWKPMRMSLSTEAARPAATVEEAPKPNGMDAATIAAGNGQIVVDQLDHVVLTVKDITVTCHFYQHVLGMQPIEYQPGRWALHFGRSKLNLHPADSVIDQHVRHALPGSADLCLLTHTPLDEVNAHLRAQGVSVIEGPTRRTGATGPLLSLYVYDPDENLIEIANPLTAAAN
jgi:catechol 2,3-dioxygenase-like lactoylglutathione lyase family enzyme